MSVAATNTTTVRYHALDSLRAAMMLLGVCIHAIAAFSTIPDVWWYRDAAAGRAFDLQLLAIHTFRMPVFFAMAGFFGALLLERRGWLEFAINRSKRILLPLVACLALLIPVLKGLQLAQRLLAKTGTVDPAHFASRYPRMLVDFNAGPYWFLLYLVYFYALVLVLQPIGCRLLTRRLGGRARDAFDALAGSARGPLVFALVSIPGLLAVPAGVFPAPQGFLPETRILMVYAPFVLFGWALYYRRERLDRFASGVWRHLGLGALTMAVTLAACLVQLNDPTRADAARLVTVAAGAWCVWEMLFGLLGLFQRHLSGEHRWWRYASDSSYWIYLVHSPVLLAVQLLVCRTAWPGSVKLAITLAVSVPVLFASYHWLVRPTWVGLWLNGRRQPGVRPSTALARRVVDIASPPHLADEGRGAAHA
jgi:glucan biosynthesis protein C